MTTSRPHAEKQEIRRSSESISAMSDSTRTLSGATGLQQAVPDVERGGPPAPDSTALGEKPDPFLVSWDGPDDPANPLNTALWRKW
jgi:hypothetical protein